MLSDWVMPASRSGFIRVLISYSYIRMAVFSPFNPARGRRPFAAPGFQLAQEAERMVQNG
jgi:hypothetical protein